VLGRYVFFRLRRALLPDFQRLWRRDVEGAVKDLSTKVSELETELAELRAFRVRSVVAEWARERADMLKHVGDLDMERVRRHVDAAVAGAALVEAPTAHLVVERVLPDDVYALLTAAIPPPELFPARDPVKRDFEMSSLRTGPEFTQVMWQLFDQQIVAGMIAPRLLERFSSAVQGHYARSGGADFGRRAAAIPHRTFAGRIQLRHPGYRLAPHLDPKRVVITSLFYFPRPGDSDTHGTALYTVNGPYTHTGMSTFFPESVGATCTLARQVPYRANSMLAFVNSGAAHGATLPPDAGLVERYTYQFYVKPVDGELKKLLHELPADARAEWDGLLT
jgi:hypothetical protein